MDVYFPQFWRLEVRGQGISTVGFWWEPAGLPMDASLLYFHQAGEWGGQRGRGREKEMSG